MSTATAMARPVQSESNDVFILNSKVNKRKKKKRIKCLPTALVLIAAGEKVHVSPSSFYNVQLSLPSLSMPQQSDSATYWPSPRASQLQCNFILAVAPFDILLLLESQHRQIFLFSCSRKWSCTNTVVACRRWRGTAEVFPEGGHSPP